MTTCPDCHGTGTGDVRYTTTYTSILQELVDEPLTVFYRCETCKGSGEVAATLDLEPQP